MNFLIIGQPNVGKTSIYNLLTNKDYNIIFVILTDGEENSSRNYDSHDIEKSILKMNGKAIKRNGD